jgi:hypothetical protein
MVCTLICFGFFPQSIVRMVAPQMRSVLSSEVETAREVTAELRHRMESLASPPAAAALQPRLRSE